MNQFKLLNVQIKLILSLIVAGLIPSVTIFTLILREKGQQINSVNEIFDALVKFSIAEKEVVTMLAVGMVFISYVITKVITYALKKQLFDIRKYANQTHEVSLMVKDASQNVSSATTEQASAIQETVATLNEINAMVSRSVENAVKSSDISNNSKKMAQEGHKAVDEMVVAIEEINKSNNNIMIQINNSNLKISEIVEVITEIATKTQVINDIVFQTKLLSFNASVEAARAGEHGKGFAVVAEEVGSLAQMSGNAAKDISSMLSESISKVEGIVNDTKTNVGKLVEDGKSKVESGVVIAKRCGEVLEDVVKNVNEVNNMIGEISEAAKQQAEGVNNISIAMNELDDTTHGNANTAYKTLECADMLINHSNDLNSCVNQAEEEVFGKANDVGETLKTKNEYKPKKKLKKANSADDIVAQYRDELSRTTANAIYENTNVKTKSAKRDMNQAIITDDNVVKMDDYTAKTKEELYGKKPKASDEKKKYKKLVVGSEEIPSEDDPRFEDI